MFTQFDNNENSMVNVIGNTTYVYLRSKVGKAKLNSKDRWNAKIGIAYAWARCTGQPEYYNEIDLPKYNPYFGETINIKFINGRIYKFKFIAEGVDNYCFKTLDGHLETYYKNKIVRMMNAE